MLYLSKLHLKNIRCFANASLTFTNDAFPRGIPWTLVLGDNGSGKTTLLRSIALAVSGETSASALLREVGGAWIREGADRGTLTATLVDSDTGQDRIVTTHISPSTGEEELDREDDNGEAPLDDLFLCGYGANRRSIGAPPPEKHSLLEAVFSLFNYDSAQLLAPETILLRLIRRGWKERDLLDRLDDVLMLPRGSTRLDASGVQIRGPWGKYVPLGALGDGYVAVLSMIVDMLGWSMLFHEELVRPESMKGIVLIDEIEQHLHPAWQKSIVNLLHSGWEHVQFIASTHAPLVAIGAADLDASKCQLFLCDAHDHPVSVGKPVEAPRGRRADQVLTSFLFGLGSTSSNALKQAIDRVAELKQKGKLSGDEQRDLAELRRFLDHALGCETEMENVVSRAVDLAIEELLREQIAHYDPETIRFEIIRQIRAILGEKP